MPPIVVRFEQAVYGSFPFRDRGYAMLAQSPGCRPEWLAELRAACQRYGERPAGAAESGAMFALRLASGPWMVVGVSPQGRDDRGRPGALAFHALFVGPRDYRRAGGDPFGLAGALRCHWTAATRSLAPGTWRVEPPAAPEGPNDGRAARIAAALARGKRVAIESAGPIDALARQVWRALPGRVRDRASVATWAFGNGNRFDLVALPRLAGVERDASYLDPTALDRDVEAEGPDGAEGGPGRSFPTWLGRARPLVGGAAVLAGVGLGLARRHDRGEARPAPSRALAPAATPESDRPPPDRSAYRDDPLDPDERRRVAEALLDLADRFEVATEPDPAAVMTALARRLRYRGPFLTADERARLAGEPGRDRDLALAWDARVRRFADDRALPGDFARGPLRWQLDTLAWSFHLDDDPDAPRRSPAEVPHALAEMLAIDDPVRPTPLAARYPALTAYAAFLARLPRR
ncbi:MAG TPA: hypothetical protein VKP69_17945 [Isosphaeraceae bacterium]|nr:hypothetical protein [Isosphaeraceae bacterium]